MRKILLVGNPNCGKTTLFNALTGENQKVGNWPGVTVEKKEGVLRHGNEQIKITDLPGIYSLVTANEGSSQDEKITSQAVAAEQFDLIVNVIDACHIERHLYLTSQLLELGKPVVVALNMTDIARQGGIEIKQQRLAEQLKAPVVEIQANRDKGLGALREAIASCHAASTPLALSLPSNALDVLTQLKATLQSLGVEDSKVAYLACRMMEGDTFLYPHRIDSVSLDDMDVLLADARYRAVHTIVAKVQHKRKEVGERLTAKIDRIVLHRFWALPVFLGVMYGMFLFAINIGGAFQDFFDITTHALFVEGVAYGLQQLSCPDWLIAVLAYGAGKGINTTFSFIPVIAAMYFFLSFLEVSGYMARAAFVVDKLMRMLGLPGKSFVPMIVGFGCNVPAIMAARTLDSERDRLLTVMMSPFMSCSARLAIYAVFVAAFFPVGGQNIVFSLYLIGILMAVATGWLLRKTVFRGAASPLIIELPVYHMPSLKRLFKETILRLRHFIIRAGKLIIPVCMLLGALNSLSLQSGLHMTNSSHESVIAWLGQLLTPLFSPMGIMADNWPATVGLLTGVFAKEVVVGSLNALYAQAGNLGDLPSATFSLWGSLQEALYSIPHNLIMLKNAFWNPLLASMPDNTLSNTVYGVMYHQFDGKAGAYAYLLFILLYIPCVSTMAVIRQESTRRLMWFSITWSILMAYSAAVIFYQLATFGRHPYMALLWISTMLTLITLAVAGIWFVTRPTLEKHYAVANT